jgi:YidC/Oxa1 family membrane protein insertase
MNERTRLVVFVVIAGALLFGWQPLMQKLGFLPATSPQIASTQPDSSTTAPVAPPATSATTLPVMPPATEIRAAANNGSLRALPATQPAGGPVQLGSASPADKTFALQMAVNPVGGGLLHVQLNDWKEHVKTDDRYQFQTPYDESATAPLSLRTIQVDGTPVDLSSAIWTVERQTDRSVTLRVDVGRDNQPLLRVFQTFEIDPRDAGGPDGPQGFETRVHYRFENLGASPVKVQGTIVGPTFPPSEQARAAADRLVVAGYAGTNAVVLDHDATEWFDKDHTSKDYTTNKTQLPIRWIGAGSNYFTGILRPDQPAQIKKVQAQALNADSDPLTRKVLITLETQDLVVNPGQPAEIKAHAFFGPRQRRLLDGKYYEAAGIEYQHVLETSSSCFCTFQWLVGWLMTLLNFFYFIFRDYGVAIIALVFIVRALLHPITKRSQINMSKMTKMGPEIERIKKKYGDDKEAMNKAMLEFYKNHGATPILGCLPMFLQMPIWIALYSGLSSTFELRHAPLFWGFTWITDLSRPDHLIEFAPQNRIDFLFLHIDGINVIPILLAIAFFIQFKLQPKPPNPTPEQQQQQTMMKWMTTLLFPLMLYPSPSGLTIYILASTIFGIIESKIIRKHIDEQEKRGTATIVDAEVIDRPRGPSGAVPAKKSGGLMGWFTQLQERAEQIRTEAEKKARKKK